jgi:hypothetical protein
MEMGCGDTNWIGPAVIMLTVDWDTSCVERSVCVCRRASERKDVAADQSNRCGMKILNASQITLQRRRWR